MSRRSLTRWWTDGFADFPARAQQSCRFLAENQTVLASIRSTRFAEPVMMRPNGEAALPSRSGSTNGTEISRSRFATIRRETFREYPRRPWLPSRKIWICCFRMGEGLWSLTQADRLEAGRSADFSVLSRTAPASRQGQKRPMRMLSEVAGCSHRIAYRITASSYRERSLHEAERLLPGRWRKLETNDTDPAPPRRS